ncbi:MAG: hypothetical protein GC200_04065 [Tepidisphaera sp.]|nr:hypothetical protein [Tepidisphaera sp.]
MNTDRPTESLQAHDAISADGIADSVTPEPALPDRLKRWLRNATIAGTSISLLVHLAGWIIAAFILVGHGPGSGSGEPGSGAVEMAIMSQGDVQALEASNGLSLETPAVPDALPKVDVDLKNLVEPGEGPGDPGAVSVSDVGPLAGGGDVGGGEGLGIGGSGGSGGGKGTSFFGIEAHGNRFAYIVDVSSSMEGGRIESLQHELERSIDELLETSEFQIYQYSDDASPVMEKDGWNQASPAGKRSAHARIELMVANGSTHPLPAFEKFALRLRPPPDAIYFLTDGEFTDDEAERITTLDRQLKIPIHCICLESREGELRMKQIAKITRGTYTYVPPKN